MNTYSRFTLTSIKNIKQASDNNKLVVFVGAGVSINSGLPSWLTLVSKLAFDLGVKNNQSSNSDTFSAEDYLKIPQLYFNERGQNEYCRKIKEIFDINLVPNPIHKLIFELNPAHIITTNYDNLIEIESSRSGNNKKYYKISSDSDFALADDCNFIIKMHGELSENHRSFVLKESDYDSYSNNFRLVETFVKGIIATHTILFVGFSAKDPNVRRILQWVKDILSDRNRPAYLIDTSYEDNTSCISDGTSFSESQRLEFEYYKNRGIFCLYPNQLLVSFYKEALAKVVPSSFDNNKAKALYSILYLIIHYESDFDYINDWYEKLKLLKELFVNKNILNAVFNADIIKVLHYGCSNLNISESQIFQYDSFRLRIFLEISDDKKNDCFYLLKDNTLFSKENTSFLNSIKDIFSKEYHYYLSSDSTDKNRTEFLKRLENAKEELKKLVVKNDKNYIGNLDSSSDDSEKIRYIFSLINRNKSQNNFFNSDVINLITYKFHSLKSIISHSDDENRQINGGVPEEISLLRILSKSYYYFLINDYDQMISELDLIESQVLFRINPLLFFIFFVNKKMSALFSNYVYFYNGYDNETELVSEFCKKYISLDINNILYSKLPYSVGIVAKYFCLESGVINENLCDVSDISDLIFDKRKYENNEEDSANDKFLRLSTKLYDFANFIVSNRLFILYSNEVKSIFYNYVRALFTCYSISKSNNISYELLALAVFILDKKQLKSILTSLQIDDIRLGESPEVISHNKSKLLKAFNNFIEISENYRKFIIDYRFSNFFEFFIKINVLDIDDLTNIISNYLCFISKSKKITTINYYNFHSSCLDYLFSLLKKIHSGFYGEKTKLGDDLYIKIIKTAKESFRKTPDSKLLWVRERLVFELIIDCIANISNKNKKNRIAKEIVEILLDQTDPYFCDYLISISSCVKKQVREHISSFLSNKLVVSDPKLTFMYFQAVENNLLTFSVNTEKELLLKIEFLLNTILNSKEQSSPINSIKNYCLDSISLLFVVYDFLMNERITNKKQIKKILDKFETLPLNTYCLGNNIEQVKQILRILKVYLYPVCVPSKTTISELTLDDIFHFNDNLLNNLKKSKFFMKKAHNLVLYDYDSIFRKSNPKRFHTICSILFPEP